MGYQWTPINNISKVLEDELDKFQYFTLSLLFELLVNIPTLSMFAEWLAINLNYLLSQSINCIKNFLLKSQNFCRCEFTNFLRHVDNNFNKSEAVNIKTNEQIKHFLTPKTDD